MKTPYISGEWDILFRPEHNGNYVNDHTIVKGSDGNWHLYGITSFGGHSYEERYFVHAKGSSLNAPLEECGRSIDRGGLAWAPCVINRGENYYMFYGPSPTSLAVSFDMSEWYGFNVTLKDEPPMAAHRDHFVLKLSEDSYLMYVAGTKEKKGAISCFSSCDLLSWQFEGFALTSGENAPLRNGCGPMESPFVLKKDGRFYLFTTYTDCSDETYNDTLVFFSDDPKRFGEYDGENGNLQPVAKLRAHAPEIIEENGKYYITTCGWLDKPVPNRGCVSIAELEWKEQAAD